MLAILLAAGRGRRLGALGRDIPKCLIRLADRTLLDRHRAAFAACGVEDVRIVLGFHDAAVRSELAGFTAPPRFQALFNEDFPRGNILSLRRGLEGLGDDEDIVVMDADVLYPTRLLARLRDAPDPNCVLLDARSAPSGEEMMIGVRDGRVARIARDIGPGPWAPAGETVGFLKVAARDVATLRACVDEVVAEGGLDEEYETAYERFVTRCVVGFAPVDDLPWTEIDFPEDIVRAETEVLPLVE